MPIPLTVTYRSSLLTVAGASGGTATIALHTRTNSTCTTNTQAGTIKVGRANSNQQSSHLFAVHGTIVGHRILLTNHRAFTGTGPTALRTWSTSVQRAKSESGSIKTGLTGSVGHSRTIGTIQCHCRHDHHSAQHTAHLPALVLLYLARGPAANNAQSLEAEQINLAAASGSALDQSRVIAHGHCWNIHSSPLSFISLLVL